MKALVIGKGRSGAAATEQLKSLGFEVDAVEGYDLVVASPGVKVKSELQLGCEELVRRGWKLFAITGSKGKSSVVKLIAEAIGGIPCGNYGRPVTDLIREKPGKAVVEVSSFQLETTTLPPDTFEAAAILNLQEDHLDRHGSKEVYHALKRKLLAFARCPFGPEFEETNRSLYSGSYFDNETLRANAEAAVAVMRVAGLDDGEIADAFARFRPLPHRFEEVALEGGVRYVDDSKATSLAALAAGVQMSGDKTRLIAGGLPKGDDPKSVIGVLTKRVKKVYLIGQSGEMFSDAWKEVVDCEICGTLDKAVEAARREAEKGDTVLLSPGTASYDQFKSFEERGEVFARLVKKGNNR